MTVDSCPKCKAILLLNTETNTLCCGENSDHYQRDWAGPRLSIARDEDCPSCGWPETYAEGPDDGAPDVIGCRKCGWQTNVPHR